MQRSTFLRRVFTGAIAAAGALDLRGQATKAADAAPPPAFDPRAPEVFWERVRALYAVTRERIYFNTGGLGPAAQPVLDVMNATTARLQAQADTGHALLAGARAQVAGFLGADPAEIVFVRNATEGNGLVAAGLALKAGDEVIFESHAHPGGSFPWLHQQMTRGIVVKVFDPSSGDPRQNLERIEALITPRTRVVQVSHVTAPTGIVMPVAALAGLCASRGIWFHVDGAQSAGMFPFSLHAIACDSYSTSGHKWLGAPHETGIFYLRRDRLEALDPVLVGAHSAEQPNLPSGRLDYAKDATRFEYGTRNAAAIIALAEATRLQERIGRERLAQRGRALAQRVRAGLSQLSDVEVLTPAAPEASGAMIAFRSPRVPHTELFDHLLRDHRMRCRPVSEQGLDALRVSTHLFNTPDECDALIAAVAARLRRA